MIRRRIAPPRPSGPLPSGRRGFTLIELLVALSGGLFVSIVVFMFARDATRFYQREGRLASATLATLAGFERLRSDIARAGFLGSPNVTLDPLVCSRPDGTAPAYLRNLASVQIVDGGSPANTTLDANDIDPDSILLAGSYGSADEYPIRAVVGGAADTFDVYLQVDTGPMARLGYQDSGDRAATLSAVFAPGRALRILDREGRQHYGVIESVTAGQEVDAEPFITLASSPPLQFREGSGRLCGLKGLETGSTAAVINFVRYDLRNLKTDSNFGGENASYARLYTDSSGAPFEADRTELVRVELDVAGEPLSLTAADDAADSLDLEELVAEYAVDLEFEISAITSPLGAEPAISHLALDPAYVGAPLDDGKPQRIRSVRTKLSVRSREADRAEGFVGALPGIASGLYRVGLGSDGGAPFARVRTLQADVMLHNQATVMW